MGSQAQKRTHTLRNAGIAVMGFLFLGTLGPLLENAQEQFSAPTDSIAYVALGTNEFGTIDLNTGVFTQIGNMGQLLSGLGVVGGRLYGGVNTGDTLYRVNPTTGRLTAVGTGSILYADTGSTTSGLYALSCLASCGVGGARDLYSINSATGAATLIGSTGIGQENIAIGMSSGGGTLYFTSDSDLYSLNTTTGAATLIGNTGLSAIGALVFENGVLYAGLYPSAQVYALNPRTGAAHLVSTCGGCAGAFWGLAPHRPAAGGFVAPIPKPSSLRLLDKRILKTYPM